MPMLKLRRPAPAEGGLSARETTNSRMKLTVLVVLAMAAILAARLFFLQILQGEAIAQTARDLRTRTYTLEAKRGEILDSKGAVLATSVERYNVRVNQTEIENYVQKDNQGKVVGLGAAAAARQLAPILGVNQAELGGTLMGGKEKSQWLLLAKGLSPDEWREINALGIHGVYPERYMMRSYPNGDVAGNIIGYTGQLAEDPEVSGRAGIEMSMNDILTGEPGGMTVEVGPGGAVFPQGNKEMTPVVDGGSVQLTIDRDLQKATQEALQKSVRANSAEWGTAAVVEIGTGRVLALADTNTPDPSNLASVRPEDWNSRAVSAIVEPGSSGKVITYSAVLNEGVVDPLDTFNVPSVITMPNGERIKDNNEHPTQRMTVAGILATSYNTGLVQIGDKIDDDVRYQYMRDFGLGQKTGIGLPNEQAGILHPVESWGSRTHYTTMFGQAWSGTTLQLAQMISIIGNDGVKIPLHIVDGTYDAEGAFTPTTPGENKRVISAETAQTMNQLMQGVTQLGSTGYYARVEGYNVSGKTGTAQVPDAHGNLTKRVGTFVGLLPAEDPQIAVAVVVYNGAGPGYGGDTAAPAFAGIGEFAMRQLKVPPSTEPLYKYPWTEAELNAEKTEEG